MPVLLAIFLAGCGVPADRYPVPTVEVKETQRIAFASVELRDVSLPTYAGNDEITVEDDSGKLVSDPISLWADQPKRAISLELARNLVRLTKARVASEPWPFEEPADARLEVRFETLLAGSDGVFRASGQYFVSVVEGRERSGLFDLGVPITGDGGPQAIARARGQVIFDLARLLAREGLR